MSDRHQQVNIPRGRYGWPRVPKPEWQLSQREAADMIARRHFMRQPQVERRWKVRTDGGSVTVVRRVRLGSG